MVLGGAFWLALSPCRLAAVQSVPEVKEDGRGNFSTVGVRGLAVSSMEDEVSSEEEGLALLQLSEFRLACHVEERGKKILTLRE